MGKVLGALCFLFVKVSFKEKRSPQELFGCLGKGVEGMIKT